MTQIDITKDESSLRRPLDAGRAAGPLWGRRLTTAIALGRPWGLFASAVAGLLAAALVLRLTNQWIGDRIADDLAPRNTAGVDGRSFRVIQPIGQNAWPKVEVWMRPTSRSLLMDYPLLRPLPADENPNERTDDGPVRRDLRVRIYEVQLQPNPDAASRTSDGPGPEAPQAERPKAAENPAAPESAAPAAPVAGGVPPQGVGPLPRAREIDPRYPFAMIVEVREEEVDGRIRVVADIGCWVLETEGETIRKALRRVPWWRTRGVAPSNSLVEVERRVFGFLRELRYPSSPTALVTWIRSNWVAVARAANPDDWARNATLLKLDAKQIEGPVADGLERALTHEWGHVKTTPWVVFLRTINGSIQLLTIAAFLAAVLVVACRVVVFLRPGCGGTLPAGTPYAADDALRSWAGCETLATDDRLREHRERWGTAPARLSIWRAAIDALESGGGRLDARASAAAQADRLIDEQSNSGYYWRWLVGSLSALGFIGTIVGIGDALMNSGSVISDALAKQQSGVSDVALALAFAFDTTLVGLLLSLVATLMTGWLAAAEEASVYSVLDEMHDKLP